MPTGSSVTSVYPLATTSVRRTLPVRTTTRSFFELIILPFSTSIQESLPHYCCYAGHARSEVHRRSIDEEHDLPAHVPGSAFFQRLGCFLEWQGALEPHGELSGVDHP